MKVTLMEQITEQEPFIPTKAIPEGSILPNSQGVLTLEGREWNPEVLTRLEAFNIAWEQSLKLHEKVKDRTRDHREKSFRGK